MKTPLAILLVSFGTTNTEAAKKTLGILKQEASAAFPGAEIRQTYTSTTVRRLLRERQNIITESLEEALERLAEDGFREVICQPTYVINGSEYDEMLIVVRKFRGRFERIECGIPLMTDFACDRLAGALVQAIGIGTDDMVVFVGHGSTHPAHAAYAKLREAFRRMGRNGTYTGTIEGTPSLCDVLAELKKSGKEKLILAPLLTVAGVHALKDVFGVAESWMTKLTDAGFAVTPVQKGLCEYAEVRSILLESIRECTRKELIVS